MRRLDVLAAGQVGNRPRLEQEDLDRDIAAIKARIGADAYESAYNTGRDLTLDHAVAFVSGVK